MIGWNGKEEDVKDPRLDQHLVGHDICVLSLAAALGTVAAIATDSAPTGLAVAALLAMTGIKLMQIGFFRRAVNRVALALKGEDR